MEKFKENLKKHWKNLLIICVVAVCVIGALVGIVLNRLNTEEAVSQVYTVEVKDENGKSIEEVYLMLYAEDGTEISWLPSVTNITGEARFSQGVGEGCYIKVVGVPIGYALDGSVKYTFDENGKITIVLGEDDSVYTARIGDIKYVSLATALSVANASSEDVVVEMLADSTLKTFTIKNNYGKTITINGNGHTLTSEGGNNTFVINQTEGTVAFENMTIKHKNTGAVVQANGLVTVNMTDAMIDATEGSAYNFALINTLAVDGTTTLNLTRVDAKMAVGSPSKDDYAGIIRTGNTSGTKTVEINLVDCNFDTEGATGRHGIVVMKNTVANITATNCTFKAGDGYAIWAVEQSKMQTLTLNNCKTVSTVDPFSASPIKGYAARIGNTYYLTLDHAAQVANTSKSDTTITVVADVTMKTCAINNAHGKLVTVDGAGRTVTTEKGNNAFVVGNNVMFKNMTINHKNTGSAIHVTESGNVSAQNVTIKATEGKTYNYSLINVLAAGKEKTTLDLARVNVVWAVESKGDANASVIRTGNPSETDSNGKVTKDNSKFVDINLTDCNFDTTKATGRTGITVTKNSTTTVNLKNTTITTMDTFAIRSNEQDINWSNADTTLTSLTQAYIDYPVEYYLAKIGEVFYTFDGALDVANKAKSDTTINMLASYTIKTNTVDNANGKLITINGNGKTITTNGGSNALVVGRNVTINNMTITHKNTGSAIQIGEAGTVSLNDVAINATAGKEYKYALINVMATGTTNLTLNGVKATMSVAGAGATSSSAIVRTGNSGEVKTVNLNMTGCNFDTTKATGRSGIIVMQKTTANISMTGTTITTLNEAPIRANESSELSYKLEVNGCTLSSKTKEFQDEPIRGYEAKIGNTVYHNFSDAISSAAAGDVIELLQDFAVGEVVIEKDVTIDGRDYTVTADDSKNGKHTFKINAASDVVLRNTNLVVERRGNLVQMNAASKLTFDGVTVDATKSSKGYEYCLINILATGTSDLTLKDTDIKMATDIDGLDSYASVIRTGNKGASNAKDVVITLNGCNLDTSKANGRHAIVVMDTTKASIDVQDTQLNTKNVSAIKSYATEDGFATISSNAELVCGKKADELEGYAIQIGNTWYVSYATSLIDAAKNATEDVTITLASDMEINLTDLVNVNGKTITIDTNGNCLTTTGTKDDSVVILSDAQVVIETTTLYLSVEDAIEQANSATADVRVELSTACDVNLTSVNNKNGKKITIDTNGNILTTTGTCWNSVSVVSQTRYESGDKTLYVKLTDALETAKTSNSDVTITVMSNITVAKDAAKITNEHNRTITIDGNNKAYEVTTGQNAFIVQGDCNVRFMDMKIAHKATQAAVKIESASTVEFENVEIEATLASGYQFGLINIQATKGSGEKVVLNMDQVNIEMNVTAVSFSNNAIVRVDSATTKKVDIDIANSELNTQLSGGIKGICIQNKTNVDVTVDLINSAILTKDDVTIHDGSDKATINKTKCILSVAEGDNVAQVGNTMYTSFADALAAAKASSKAVTIDLLDDLSISQAIVIENSNQKAITIDGNMYDITTTAKNAIQIKSVAAIKNANIEHDGQQSAIVVSAVTTVDITDVAMTASTTGTTNLKYGLINLSAKNGTTILNLTRVNVTVANGAYTESKPQHAIIRTGNNDEVRTVYINLVDCNLDATNAPDRSGILVMDATTAHITLNNSKIYTQNSTKCAPIYVYAVDTTVAPDADRTVSITDDCELKLGNSTVQADVIKNIASDKITVVATGAGAAVMLLEEETGTKTLIMDVPAELYDALVDWIKQFATKNGWALAL